MPRRWLFYGMAALSVMMFSIDMTIVSVALPWMVRDLDTSLALAGWVLTAGALVQTIVMPLAGKLSEQFGQMRVFIICTVLFTIGSLLCGIAPNIYVLIACRALQALGGGGFMPTAAGIIAQSFPEKRNKMLGLFATIFPIGGIIGPNLGGVILEHLSWREIFLVNVPIGLVVLVVLLRHAQAPAQTKRRQVDLLGAALLTASSVALLLDLTFLARDPAFIGAAMFWVLLTASAALLAAFAWQERRAPEPILEMDLVTRHPFLVVNVYNFLFGACVFGVYAFIPYYATVQFGMGAMESGAAMSPRSLMMIVISAFTSLVLLQYGYRLPMILGLVSLVLSTLLLGGGWESVTLGSLTLGAFPLLAIIVGLSGVGMGLVMPSSNNASLDLMPERAAILTGIRGLFRSMGGVIGTALIVLALELSPDKAAGMRMIFIFVGILLMVTIPLVFFIPDSVRAARTATPGGTPTASPTPPKQHVPA